MPVRIQGTLPPHTEEQARSALGLYAVADYSATDFLDMLYEEKDDRVVEILYVIVSTPNPDQTPRNAETNRLVAPIVKGNLQARGIKV